MGHTAGDDRLWHARPVQVARPDPVPEPVLLAALVAEAARKSRVCWLSYEYAGGAERERLVWHVWHEDALVVLLGEPAGQQLPGAHRAGLVEVTMRSKDTGGRLLSWTARARVVDPAEASWERHAAALLGVRLNLPDPAAALSAWRASCTVLRLEPVLAPAVAPPEGEPGALP